MADEDATILRPQKTVPEHFDLIAKICVVGDSGVGKSSLLRRYVDDVFDRSFITTIGVDFFITSLTRKDGTVVKLQLWDTAGQERFATIVTSYYRGSHGIVVVFDVTCRESFSHVGNWMTSIREKASSEIPVVLVGNKADCREIQVSSAEAEHLTQELGFAGYYETSAKNPEINDYGIYRMFGGLVNRIQRTSLPKLTTGVSTTKLGTKSWCC